MSSGGIEMVQRVLGTVDELSGVEVVRTLSHKEKLEKDYHYYKEKFSE